MSYYLNSTNSLLELKNIIVRVQSRILVELDSLTLRSGVVALVGRNGSGKSTLIRTWLGDHKNVSGEVIIAGRNSKTISVAERSKLIAMVSARTQIFGDHKVRDVLALGRLPHVGMLGKLGEADRLKIKETAAILGIETWSDRIFSNLSDGEKQLVMVARTLVQDTPIVLMDEPTAFLDAVNRQELSALLHKVSRETGKLIIYSTHQYERIQTDCDYLLLLHDGKLKLYDTPEEFMDLIKHAFKIL